MVGLVKSKTKAETNKIINDMRSPKISVIKSYRVADKTELIRELDTSIKKGDVTIIVAVNPD